MYGKLGIFYAHAETALPTCMHPSLGQIVSVLSGSFVPVSVPPPRTSVSRKAPFLLRPADRIGSAEVAEKLL